MNKRQHKKLLKSRGFTFHWETGLWIKQVSSHSVERVRGLGPAFMEYAISPSVVVWRTK